MDVPITVIEALGEIDLFKLLEECAGVVEYELIDAGMVRSYKEVYEYGPVEDNENLILIRPASRKPNSTITIPAKTPLSLSNLILFGMYDGDGNKTGDIGFAQNNPKLQVYVAEGIEKIFPGVFHSRVNILEDSKYFESPELTDDLNRIRAQLQAELGQAPSEKVVQERYLLEEFEEMDMDVGTISRTHITVSSKKGSRSSGKRSYEIIVNKAGSAPYRPLFVYLIKKTMSTIMGSEKSIGISWRVDPRNEAIHYLDVERYVESDRCRYLTKSGRRRQYSVVRRGERYLELRKPGGGTARVIKYLPISPFLCLLFGIYWAEGATAKAKLFSFRDKYESGLGLGFNSSEDIGLAFFIDGISQIFPQPEEIISGWLVKIGAKYHAETSALASKLGVPATRGGPGGDGIARTVEFTMAARDWALQQFPVMKNWLDYFSHIEFTGIGIPRVDIRCSPSMSQFFFSLMCDLTFYEDQLFPYLKPRN